MRGSYTFAGIVFPEQNDIDLCYAKAKIDEKQTLDCNFYQMVESNYQMAKLAFEILE